MKKKCSKCKKRWEIRQFYRNKSKKDGHDEYCKDCRNVQSAKYKRTSRKYAKKVSQLGRVYYRRNRDRILARMKKTLLMRKYGLTKAQYKRMLKSQGCSCAICRSTGRLVVDHDHSTGKIRGLLCNGCNSGLGFFKDSPPSLRRAARYLTAKSS